MQVHIVIMDLYMAPLRFLTDLGMGMVLSVLMEP